MEGRLIPDVIFGTANLFGLVASLESEALLHAAWDTGFRSFDTAPAYGYGESEAAVGRLLARRERDSATVTTKVGIAPTPRPRTAMRVAKSVARRLPAGVQQRLRGDSPPGHGHFEIPQVRASLDRSLRRLGRIDRLMLHEVSAGDITDELVSCLAKYLEAGDVGCLGVATGNERTAAALARAPQLLQAVHLEIGPSAGTVAVPAGVAVRVGHGALGPGGKDLAALTARVTCDDAWSRAWARQAEGTPWGRPGGIAELLLARASILDLSGVIVATSRRDRLTRLRSLVGGDVPPDPGLLALMAQTAQNL